MKTTAIIGIALCILMAILWVLRRDDVYIGLKIDKTGAVQSREERMISVPVISDLVMYSGVSDGAIRFYGGYAPYALEPILHNEVKEFINAYGHLGFHDGWGCANYGKNGNTTRVGIQCGIGSGSIARNWTLENGKLTHVDFTTK